MESSEGDRCFDLLQVTFDRLQFLNNVFSRLSTIEQIIWSAGGSSEGRQCRLSGQVHLGGQRLGQLHLIDRRAWDLR